MNEEAAGVKPYIPRIATIDPDAMVYYSPNGREVRYKPTQRQLKAEYYRAQGDSKAAAARKAGYSGKHPGTNNIFSQPLEKYLSYRLRNELVKRGMDEKKIADKMLQWIDAKKIYVAKGGHVVETEDVLTQIKAYEKIDQVLHFSDGPEQRGLGSHQKLTIEQWTFGDTEDEKPKPI